MPDPLRRLFARLDGGPVTLDAADRRELDEDWPALASAGLVAETTAATRVECGSCDEPHSAGVFPVETAGLPTRWFHSCRTFGSVQIEPEELRRWAVRVPAFGRVVAGRDGAERLPGVVWRLGPMPVGSAERVGWLVAGWRNRTGVADAVPELLLPNAVAFVPCHPPPPAVWGTAAPPVVIPLADVLRSDGTALAVNAAALAPFLPPAPTAVVEVDVRPRLSLPAGTRWPDITLVVGDHDLALVLGSDRHRIGYEELGLADGRTRAPHSAWLALAHLARVGELAPDDGIDTKSGTLKNNLTRLRAALRRWTGLAGDPIPAHRLGPYRPRFRVRPADTLKSV